MKIRNLASDDVLPWTTEEIGWSPAQLDPRTVWIAESAGAIVGMIIAAEVHQTLLILRVLGKGGSWLRPAWRAIRLACFHRNIGAFWTIADNSRPDEVRLAEVVRKDDAEFATWYPQEGFALAGRWHAVPGRIRTDPGSDCTVCDGSRSCGESGSDGIRTSQPAFFGAIGISDCSPAGRTGPADGCDPGRAESGIPGRAAERAGGDGRGIDGDSTQYGDGPAGGSSIRSQLYREIFGTDPRRGS
jgi:hypothetical protein